MGQVLKFTRDEDGVWSKYEPPVVVKGFKYVGGAFLDVVKTYSNLLYGLLDVCVRVGLFILLWPLIRNFINAFLVEVSKAGLLHSPLVPGFLK